VAEYDDVLHQWVVYDNPTDYPGMFVAREWIIGRGTMRPSEVTPYVDPYLENVRRFIAAVAPGSFCITRSPEDDPTIVETWT
jgi:hypothetical protein